MAKMFYYVLVFIFVSILDGSSSSKCVNQNSCLCSIDDFAFISLSQLHPLDKKTFFQDGKEQVSYFFSGCENKTFTPADYKLVSNETIHDVSLVKCISSINPNLLTNSSNGSHLINQTCKAIGYAKDIVFDLTSGSTKGHANEYQIIFVNKSSNISFPTIRLACDTFNQTNLKILNSNTDDLVLYSPLVCIQHISHHELSTGSIFCIIFFVTAFTYFIGGALLMYVVRGARGAEIIPNFDFWASIPGLIRDGMIYILSGCRPFTISTAETYDKI